MPFGWLSLFAEKEYDHAIERRMSSRPDRGKRVSVKAARRAARRNRRR